MNTRRSVSCSLPSALLFLAFSATVTGQRPSLPTLARLDALKLNAIEGDLIGFTEFSIYTIERAQ